MQINLGPAKKEGIRWCINCVGQHPDHQPSFKDFYDRTVNPQKDAWSKVMQYKEKAHLYKGKSCSICGRTYNKFGELEKTWVETARRVKKEMEFAGIYGVDDKKVELIVARCRKSVEFLFANRFQLNPRHWDKFTFSGTLATIITHAQEARRSKLGTEEQFKGPVGQKK